MNPTIPLSSKFSGDAAAAPSPDLHARFLELLGVTSSLLLEDTSDKNLTEVLRLLVDATGVAHCMLFINHEGSTGARLRSTWSGIGVSSPGDFEALHYIDYATHSLLADTMHAGIVLTKNSSDLPPAERALLASCNAKSALFIPLLPRGELEGFVGFLSQRPASIWRSTEVSVLCAVVNNLALALARGTMEQTLRASEARLRTLVGATEDTVIEYDARGAIINIWSNGQSATQQLQTDLVGAQFCPALPPEMSVALSGALRNVVKHGGSENIEFSVTENSGDHYYFARLQCVPSENGQATNVVALVRDMTSLMRDEAQRQSMLETLNLLDEAIIELSADGRLLNASAAWQKLCGHPRGTDDLFTHYVHADDQRTVLAALQSLHEGSHASDSVRFRMPRSDGGEIWVECRLLASRDPRGQVNNFHGILRDITSTHLQEKRIAQLALHDALTQLPNRILLEEHLHQAIARAQRANGKVALGFIDLDHFKQINDTMGHKAGDRVLLTLSQRLQSVLREIDTLSRWGGDEFVVLLPDASCDASFRAVAERLREVARKSIDIDGVETQLTISIGFAVYPDDADNADTLMSVADHTMFHAKSMGRNNVKFFRDIHDKTLDRENVLLQTRLNSAVQARRIQVFYQPVVHMDSHALVAVEALARWYDDPNGWVSPEIFIPLAEHLGIIQEVGDQVFDHALMRLQGWRSRGFEVQVAINISRAQLFANDFTRYIEDKVRAFGLQPSDLLLEITESVALLDVSYESKRLRELREAGFCVAIDDFGTGYSALAQLHQMPIDMLKIDASFTSRLNTPDGHRIVQAIVQMAQALNLDMVVEGVETQEAALQLTRMGVKKLQGFYFSDPLPAGMCEMLLQNGLQPPSRTAAIN